MPLIVAITLQLAKTPTGFGGTKKAVANSYIDKTKPNNDLQFGRLDETIDVRPLVIRKSHITNAELSLLFVRLGLVVN